MLDRSWPIKKAGIVELLKCSAKLLAGPAGSKPEFTEVYKYLADFSSTVSSLNQYPTLEMRLLIPKEDGTTRKRFNAILKTVMKSSLEITQVSHETDAAACRYFVLKMC